MEVDTSSGFHPQLAPLVGLVEERPEAFATGDVEIHTAALEATKFVFDLAIASEPIAEQHISELLQSLKQAAPQTRSQTAAANGKRKREPSPSSSTIPTFTRTPLESLFLPGMNADQIWEQLELRTKSICNVLDAIVQEDKPEDGVSESSEGMEDRSEDLDMDQIGDFDELDSEDDDEDEDEDEDEDDQEDAMGVTSDDEQTESEDEPPFELHAETTARIKPGEDELMPNLDLDRPRPVRSGKGGNRPAHPVLDDGFFSIDDFNRETEELEASSRSKGRLAVEDDEDEEGEDVDLFKSLEETDAFDEEDEEADSTNAMYKDFFEAPARLAPRSAKKQRRTSPPATFGDEQDAGSPSESPPKRSNERGVKFSDSVRVKTIESRGQNRAAQAADFEEEEEEEEENVDWDMTGKPGSLDNTFNEDDWPEDDDEGEEGEEDGDDDEGSKGTNEADSGVGTETIQRLRNDLFDDEDDEPTNISTHQKRLADIASEIAAFEQENVGVKDWTLMGEASARGRPVNSLLEEDLDFERVAKAVPVITEETTQTLEDRIKARILENRFNDVVRKRPIDDKPFLPSKVFELQDTQSARSLAQIYEDEYTATRSGDGTTAASSDDRDGKLAKEHQEIEKAWGEICYKLDALCNAHFTPKQPKATISTVSNLASTTLESALPTTMSIATLLAPEEIHAAPLHMKARSELTPQEKRALRTKERKTRKKRRDAMESAVGKFGKGTGKAPRNVKEAKGVALNGLVKTGKGVTVIGKGKREDRSAPKKGTRTNGDGRQWKL